MFYSSQTYSSRQIKIIRSFDSGMRSVQSFLFTSADRIKKFVIKQFVIKNLTVVTSQRKVNNQAVVNTLCCFCYIKFTGNSSWQRNSLKRYNLTKYDYYINSTAPIVSHLTHQQRDFPRARSDGNRSVLSRTFKYAISK